MNDIKWTREELEQQRDDIISEYNFHEVRDFMYMLFQEKKISVHNDTIYYYRHQAREIINDFIKMYLEHDSAYLSSRGWEVRMSYEYDNKTPFLALSYKYEVGSEVEPYEFITNYNKRVTNGSETV